MNGETKCARFLGSPGPAEPENLAHLLLPSLHHSNGKNGKATCVGMGGTPRSAPTQSKTPFLRKEFYHSKSGPGFSIFARSLLLPTPNERRPNVPGFWARPGPRSPKTWHICSFPPCTTATARPHVQEWGEPRDRPRPQSKTPFSRKEFINQNLALIFQFLPAPSSSLHPMNGETKFGLTRPRGARKPGTFAPSFPAPSERQDGSAPTPIKNAFLRKEFITQNLALVFQFLPAPFSSLHPMNGETKCARFLGSPGRSPKIWHICSFTPCTTATARPHVPEWREPRDRPRPQSKTPFLRKEFITQNLALPSPPYTQ